MTVRTWVVLGVVVICATAHADELPFEIQNARKAGITDRVETGANGAAEWRCAARVVVAGAGGEKDTKGLAVEIGALEGEKGARSSMPVAKLATPPEKLAPGQGIELAISAAFPRAGEYRGELLLLQGTVQRVVAIAIKVEAPAVAESSLVEHGKAIVALGESWTGDVDTAVRIQLRNAGVRDLVLEKPRVMSAKRVDKVAQPTRESQIGAGVGSAAAVGAVKAGDVAAVGLELSGLDDPGVYQLEVQIPVTGYAPKSIDVTVLRRAHWLCAMLWIALGVAIAYGVRRFTQGGKDRLKTRRTLAELRPRLTVIRDEARDPAHVAAAMVLGAELDQRLRDVRWQSDGAALLKTATRLVARVYLLGEIVAAARIVARLDAAAQVEPRKVLDEALAAARVDPGPDKAADIDEQRRKVAKLAIEDAWRAKLRAALAELKQAMDALAGAGGSDVRQHINTELRPELTRAGAALTGNRLDDAATALDRLHTAFLAIAIDDLRLRMLDAPLGARPAPWQQVISIIKNHLDVAAAPGDWPARRDAFTAAQRAYFKAAITALVAYARDRAASTDDPPEDAARLTAIASELKAELDAGDPGIDRAAQLYAERRAEVELAARPRGDVTKVSRTQAGACASWITLSTDPGERGTISDPPTIRLLDAQIRYTEWLVVLAILAIAVASGVRTLWLNNLSWGVQGDALAAFLWGAGVGAAGDAFTGLAGLREKLGGTA